MPRCAAAVAPYGGQLAAPDIARSRQRDRHIYRSSTHSLSVTPMQLALPRCCNRIPSIGGGGCTGQPLAAPPQRTQPMAAASTAAASSSRRRCTTSMQVGLRWRHHMHLAWRCLASHASSIGAMVSTDEQIALPPAPHLGGAYSTMAVDVIARYQVNNHRKLDSTRDRIPTWPDTEVMLADICQVPAEVSARYQCCVHCRRGCEVGR